MAYFGANTPRFRPRFSRLSLKHGGPHLSDKIVAARRGPGPIRRKAAGEAVGPADRKRRQPHRRAGASPLPPVLSNLSPDPGGADSRIGTIPCFPGHQPLRSDSGASDSRIRPFRQGVDYPAVVHPYRRAGGHRRSAQTRLLRDRMHPRQLGGARAETANRLALLRAFRPVPRQGETEPAWLRPAPSRRSRAWPSAIPISSSSSA